MYEIIKYKSYRGYCVSLVQWACEFHCFLAVWSFDLITKAHVGMVLDIAD